MFGSISRAVATVVAIVQNASWGVRQGFGPVFGRQPPDKSRADCRVGQEVPQGVHLLVGQAGAFFAQPGQHLIEPERKLCRNWLADLPHQRIVFVP